VASRGHSRQAARTAAGLWRKARLPRLMSKGKSLSGPAPPPPAERERDEVEEMAGLFRALADPACLRLLEFLATEERTIPECAAHTSLPASSVRHHLACLEKTGWIELCRHDSCRMTDARAVELLLLARSLAANNAGALVQCLHLDRPQPCG
jgi:ArsR family transcriptional regulator, cadmium/lead-responsive transcriptional repressor